MKKLFLLLALCLAPQMSMGKDIHRDLGGYIEPRFAEIENLKSSSDPIRILGNCASACTLYLALPQTCLGPNARLGFHGPSGSTGVRGVPLNEYLRLIDKMADHYPHGLADWFMDNAAYEMDNVIWKSGRDLVKMGFASCS